MTGQPDYAALMADTANLDAERAVLLHAAARLGAWKPDRETLARLLAMDDDFKADRNAMSWDALAFEARRNYLAQADLIRGGWE